MMPSFEREQPSDRHLRHQHSGSSSALVPMWDSSDPDRAPPPLPLNPQSPSVGVGTSRAGTSLAIQNAHAALTAKAQENALVPLQKRSTDFSPERAFPQRTSPHKRMQSLQPGSVRDLSLMIEASRDSANSTPRGSPEKEKLPRPATPVRGREPEKETRSVDRDPSAIGSISIPLNMTPTMRPAPRWPQQSILGENTPPQSATMLALQNMSSPPSREFESPLATVTNNATPQPKTPASHEQLSNQLLTLTNIATALQREMTALSRRSRDNATDLMSLKEATHARDEDIRKSLRELASNVDPTKNNRDTYNGGLYLENKAFNSSPVSKHARPYALPRIPSPTSFAASLDRESVLSTPSLVGGETPATMALLEKIIREMNTKDGQDMILDRLSELAEKLAGMPSGTKVEEVLDHVKAMRQDQAVIHLGGNGPAATRSLSFDSTSEDSVRGLDWDKHNGARTQKAERLLMANDGRPASAPSRPQDILNDDIIKIIHSVKDSVAQGGGLTAEVKALVRELRGEVLGMGRELGRKLEESGSRSSHSKGEGHSKSETASRAELARIVEEGLEQMKVYMQQRLREHRRESTESEKSVIDYEEIYNAMRTAISDSQAEKPDEPQLSRDDVLNAVKDAWENYKPVIEIQQLGLERDEVLACIKQGFQEYAPQPDIPESITKEEVFNAVVEGMKHFEPPKIDTPESLSRDEVLEAVRECLEEFEFPVAPSALDHELTRDDMLHAVKQGLAEFDFPNPNTALVPHDGGNSEILERLQDVMQYMRDEFDAVSQQAKKHVTANERDTEQVLDATKQGFESLRAHIEEYVDRVSEDASTAGNEELMANLVNSFDSFRNELSEMLSKASDSSRDLVKQEIESLRDAVNGSLVPHVPPPIDNREALEAIREGLDRVRTDLLRPHAGTTDILDALHEGFGDLRNCMEKINDKPVDLTANDEILDALKSGLDDVRADIDTLRGSNDNDKAVVSLSQEHPPMDALIPTDLVKHDDIKNLEVIMTDLQIKMSALELARPAASSGGEGGLSKEDLAEMEEILRNAVSKEDLLEMEQRLQNGVSKEDLAEMERRLQNGLSKERLEELEQRLEGGVSKEDLNEMGEMLKKGVSKDDLNQMEDMLRGMQESMVGMGHIPPKDGEAPPINLEDAATKEDVQAIETILRNAKARLDELIDGEQAVRKDHVDAVEALVMETKDSFGALATQLETVTHKEDLVTLESLVTQITVAVDEMKERAEKSLEDPEKVTKTDVEAIGASVVDVKTLIEKLIATDIAALTSKDDLNKVEEVVRDIKDYNTTELPSKEDLRAVEDVVRIIKDHAELALPSKDDLKLVEDVVREIKEHNTVLPSKDELKAVEDIIREIKDHNTALASKDDLKNVEDIVKEIKDHNTAQEEANSTALANRQAEVVSVNERVADVKAFLEEFQSAVKERLEAGGNGVETLGRMLEGLGETINQNANVGSDLKEMFELMKTEFEDSKSGVVGAKIDTDEKLKETADLLNDKFDLKIGELVTKYDEFQLVLEDRTKAGEARDLQMEAAVVGNKAVAEELKVLIDTLGSTVTDSLEKMEEASKTVFEKVELLYSKAEDRHAEGKTEHEMTREQVKQAIGVVEGLQGHVSDYQPKILEAVKDVLLLVGQHYEHSKESTTGIQQSIEDARPPPPAEPYDDAAVRSKLDSLDAGVHTKLDTLVGQTQATADEAHARLEALDRMHQQVARTAAEIGELLAAQRQRGEREREERERALQQATAALERRQAEQDHVTASLAMLRTEEAQLRERVLGLRTEQESLTRQRTRLTADVSSLETALHIRRDELHAMEARADGLERRILEGVLDHSRALLITKSGANKGREAMSRKRVARSSLGGAGAGESNNSNNNNNKTSARRSTSKSRAGANIAVNGGSRASLIPPNSSAAAAAAANRRILSLSQITNNVPTGGLKRSQSVRTPAQAGLRKTSWAPGGGGAGAGKGYGELDKENVVDSVREMDEESRDEHHHHPHLIDNDEDVEEDEEISDVPDTPVDAPTPVSEEDIDDDDDDDDEYAPHADADDDDEDRATAASDAGTLRRTSLGSTVVTGAATAGGDGYADDDLSLDEYSGGDDDSALSDSYSVAADSEIVA
ncbi:putative chromosome segregation ATPase [Rosellinia necatrix]|uniref:Putative chromosome segregation ATPase n=1 Tax=Rosellinia necatrix TaxID=77044 RepID=A0A1W2TNZ9_ROSNE|nr:putative chromosome segregation ATPase [Rosellinia necatrix]